MFRKTIREMHYYTSSNSSPNHNLPLERLEEKFNCWNARKSRELNICNRHSRYRSASHTNEETHKRRRKLTGVLDVHRRRRVGSRDDGRRRHLGVQGGEAWVRHVVDEISTIVSARTAHFQFILTGCNRHFRVSRPQIQPHPPGGAPITTFLIQRWSIIWSDYRSDQETCTGSSLVSTLRVSS